MRFILCVVLSLCLGSTAHAAGGGGGGGGGNGNGSGSGGANRILTLFNLGGEDGEGEAVEEEDDPRSFTMPAVVAPLSDAQGRLTGFAYVLVRIRVAAGQDVWSVQENAHYALDALVRAAHRVDLSTEDGSELDRARAAEVWAAVMAELHGPSAIENLEIRAFDVRLLRR